MKNLLPISLMLLTAILGCSAERTVRSPQRLPIQEVMKKVLERNQTIKTLKGEGSITIENPEESVNGTFELFLRNNDSLLLEIRGPFGMRVGTVAVTRERTVIHDWIENKTVVGSKGLDILNNIIPLSVQFEDIFKIFTGGLVQEDAQDSVVDFINNQDTHYLKYRSKVGFKKYWIDNITYCLTAFSMEKDGNEAYFTGTASDIAKTGGVYAPATVQVIFPADRRSLSISYDDFDLNVPVSCAFSFPSKTEIIYR